MPLYEYKCGCGNVFEHLTFKINDDKIPVCPECNSKNVKRIMSNSNFRLKGYWADSGYSKKPQSGSDVIKDGPVKSIEKLKSKL